MLTCGMKLNVIGFNLKIDPDPIEPENNTYKLNYTSCEHVTIKEDCI